ncbi:MAG: hypothetical protein EXS52_00565 [Candidatus Staskawiczbacteria bacterium]|nr:hypothetical protein [Candidatus Staskawiczbacteria bacterium]
MENMQSLKSLFRKGAVLLSALTLLVAFLPTPVSAAVCSQSTTPLRNLAGLTSIVITEKTGTNNVLTYTQTSSSLNFGTSDLNTTAVEHYDFFYSDADGTANTNGSYITSKMHRDVSGTNAQAGNNIDSMKLVVGSSTFYADLVASYQLGASVSSVGNAALSAATGAPDGLVSTVGDQDSRITLGFCSAFIFTTDAQCNDGIDNDNDGATDYPNDFSCSSATDNDEGNPKAACQDGIDNDSDGLTDYPNDTGCSSKQDYNEFNQITNTLNVSCIANPSLAQVNQSINFIANVSGGTGSYNYSWSGACSSSAQTCYNSFATPGTYAAVLYITSGSQTRTLSCPVTVTQQISQCTNHLYQQCQNNAVYWYNSCGQQQDVFQYCNSNQTCSNNACINHGGQSTLFITKTVKNLSAGNASYFSLTQASPLDVVEFKIVIQGTGNQSINNVIVKDSLPANLLYNNNLKIDGVASGSNIIQQLSLGSLYQGQVKTITYWAQVAQAQNFTFGTTTLNNSATVTADGSLNPSVANASVVVNRTGVLGATDVSTGLTNNPWVDNFFIPLMIVLAGIWLIRKNFVKKLSWIGKK